MKELVSVKNGEVYCDSQTVADKFGKRHLYVVKKIEQLVLNYNKIKGSKDLPLNFKEDVAEYRKQKYKMYWMDRRTFSLLVMQFSGNKALLWQSKFNDAFYEMEKILIQEASNKNSLEWKQQRLQAIEARKEEADVIKEFVEYATRQGSQNAKFYYKHITESVYKCLNLIQHKQPKIRETLDFMQQNQLVLAEKIAKDSLLYHMQNGEHYKTIFVLLNQELEKFGESLNLNRHRIEK